LCRRAPAAGPPHEPDSQDTLEATPTDFDVPSLSVLNHVAIAVADIEASIAFYERFARMQTVQERQDGGRVVWLSDLEQDFVLVLAEGPEVSIPMGRFAHFGVECESRQEVDRLSDEAREAGVLAAGPKLSGSLYWAYIRDPDGHQVEVSHGGDSISEAVAQKRGPS